MQDLNNFLLAPLDDLVEQYREHADPERASAMEKYMKNKFSFLGIQRPLRNRLHASFIRSFPADHALLHQAVERLWELPQREFQYLAIDLLQARSLVHDTSTIDLCEELILSKSWWDTVDALASSVIGLYFLKHGNDKRRINRWSASGELWLIRTAIIVQLKHGKDTDKALLFDLIKRHGEHPDFFIRKAIGWALRQYSRSAPDAVRHFVKQQPLSPLSRREALRNLMP